MRPAQSKPAVLVLSSQVGRGAIGGSAASFALQRMGFPVWFLPTIILPFHPGHGPVTRILPDTESFSAALDDVLKSSWTDEIGAVLAGYLGDPVQAHVIAEFIAELKRSHPTLTVMCDPVIGDSVGAYVPQAVFEAQRDVLLPLADIATPNRHELALLTEGTPTSNSDLVTLARRLDAGTVAVTSAFAGEGRTGTLLVEEDAAFLAENETVEHAPHGTGDLFSALLLAHRLDGRDNAEALSAATSSLVDVLACSVAAGSDEMLTVAAQEALVRPIAVIPTIQLPAK